MSDVKEVSGKGITAIIDGKKVAAGNEKMMLMSTRFNVENDLKQG